MKKILCRLFKSESGQASTEYMFMLHFAVVLCFILFLFVPYFTDGFNVLLDRILGGHYHQSEFTTAIE